MNADPPRMDPDRPIPDRPALDLTDASSVASALRDGARAARSAACRRGSIDVIRPPGTLIATGDLHDNPVHLRLLLRAANLAAPGEPAPEGEPRHLVLHELIHGDRLHGGMDFSYRVLAKVAALKAAYPEHVHVLLANHELSQIAGAGIVKDGVRVVQAFDDALDAAFEGDAPVVRGAIREFIMALPLALRAVTPRGDVLCAHSVPGSPMMARFDPTILTRDLTEADYEPRKGSAYWMVWGRDYDAEQLEDLVERWGVGLFVLGHQKAEDGVKYVPPCAVVLNSDHERGVYLPIDLEAPPRAEEAAGRVVRLSAALAGE